MEAEYELLMYLVQQRALAYFQDLCNPTYGLVADSTWHNAPSSIATAFLIVSALVAAQYSNGDTPAEREDRRLADEVYQRVEWSRILNDDLTIKHGWFTESEFIPCSVFWVILDIDSAPWGKWMSGNNNFTQVSGARLSLTCG